MGGDCIAPDGETAAHDAVKWKPVSLTFVEYPEGDFTGKILAYISLMPVSILVGFVALLIFRRELHTLTFLVGVVCNEAVSWVAKHIIQEPRPCRGHDVLFSEYGMPSSHSQFMWFFAVYIILFTYIRLHPPNSNSISELLWRHCLAVGVIVLALLVSISRVYLNYHTIRQVVCGAFLGIILAVPWFILTQLVFSPLFPQIVAWPISEFFLIRDSSLIPKVLWFEYTSARTEARNRQRKLGAMGNRMS
ncbi:dolichyldiphosphatase 1-like [Apostichopus japonicus]|uniref:dolichyldiphosphatase 1-like n=1 Tax=Stichopus japonicus TaxID=307972 RepID=UPI003AB1598E